MKVDLDGVDTSELFCDNLPVAPEKLNENKQGCAYQFIDGVVGEIVLELSCCCVGRFDEADEILTIDG